MFHNQPNLFEDPKIDYPIHDLQLSFADYIEQSKQIIASFRKDLTDHKASMIIEANAPFELRPRNAQKKIKYGALLIHGLLDSPSFMKDIGARLQTEDFLVRAIVLPGHGTVPGALLNVDYEQWMQAVRYGIATLAEEVDEIFLVGFSTGASLALYHALQHPEHIKGLILLSPAIKIRSYFDFVTNWHNAISFAWKRAAWFHVDPQEMLDYAKYRSLPFNAIHQVYRLAKAIKKIGHPKDPTCPLFFSLSMDDVTVSSKASIDYFTEHAHKNSRMILYTDKKIPIDRRVLLRNSVYPEQHIVSLSHNAIPIAPDNPHYGMNGDYPNASHPDQKHMVFGEFSHFDIKLHNLGYEWHLTKTLYSRLTYNPDFNFLMKSIHQFIENSL